jgi:hypothetical protein
MNIPVTVTALMFASSHTLAQHEHTAHPTPPKQQELTLFQSDMRRMTGMVPVDPMGATPMPGWQWMTMGVVRFGYNHQGGDRGDDDFESTNWFMWMGHHELGPGRLTLMMMNSLEPATIPDPGSPQLFQTGETFDGEPLVDYQHPHDFFMNLSVTYRASLSPNAGVWAQVAPVGEPALGPVAFMHRPSSGDNPSAPLGHHWQDSSHISYNVVTVGGGWNRLTLDGSAFHGAEPDEERWDVDGGKIDSYSGRATAELSRRWSAQASFGHLHEPEPTEPGDLERTTASLCYDAAGDGSAAFELVWGRNEEAGEASNSLLAEYAHQLSRAHQVYTRFEWVEKDEHLLATREEPEEPGPFADVTALTLGYFCTSRILGGQGLGADVTFYLVPSSLEPEYGSSPVSIHVFARARWMEATGGTHHH